MRREVKGKNAVGIELTYVSKAGEEGFPGDLTAKVTYWLTDKNEIKIDYAATADTATICNLTHHSYFNLGGEGSGDILGTEITLHADEIYSGRFDAYHHRRIEECRKNSLRFPQTDDDWRAHQR